MKFVLLLAFSCASFAQTKPPAEGATLPLELPKPDLAPIDPNKVVLQVGDLSITAQQLDYLIDVYPAANQVFLRGAGRAQFGDTLVRMLVLAEEARKIKADQSDKFKEQMRFS